MTAEMSSEVMEVVTMAVDKFASGQNFEVRNLALLRNLA